MGIFLLVVGLILFIGLVVIHELGHFWAARRGGVTVEEFGLFFPPRLWRKRMKSGYDFTVNLLPLGGFVKLKGEHDSDTGKGSYGAARTRTKVKIMLAGVFMNLVTAVALFTVLALVGMPKLIDNQFTVKSDTKVVRNDVLISFVEPGSPAAKAGLEQRDRLVTIGNRVVTSSKDLPNLTEQFAGKPTKVIYVRDGQTRTTTATFRTQAVVSASSKSSSPKGYLGVQPIEFALRRSTWSAPVVAVGLTAQLTALTYQGLGHALAGLGGIFAGFFTNNHVARQHAQTVASSQVSGPVGIFVILKDGSLLGYQFMLLIIAVISLTLAIMNVLPIPALDGGRLFVMLVSRLFRIRISPQAEEGIYSAGFAVLIGLIVLVTVVDVKRFF
ncbi:MAG TPA: site-2 protease family protein [Candidatus Saccharimonadales bacterium]|nr:site-2 protease family protein [Candidatus Saccharimonadales bacterium]